MLFDALMRVPEETEETPVTAPVPPLKEVTPVLVKVTEPVALLTAMPVPETAVVTPTFWMERLLPEVEIVIPVEALRAIVPVRLPREPYADDDARRTVKTGNKGSRRGEEIRECVLRNRAEVREDDENVSCAEAVVVETEMEEFAEVTL